MSASYDDARDALLAAALAFHEAEGAPNIDGVGARAWRRMQLVRAADAYGQACAIKTRGIDGPELAKARS